jgi:hypothetical protein
MINLEGRHKPYEPKDEDEIKCEAHGVVTTWGALSPTQRLAVEEGFDTTDDLPCILLPHLPENWR